MVGANNVTHETDDYWATTTDGYHGTSALAHQMRFNQNMTTDEYWLHYNITDVYQSYQNVTTDGAARKNEISRGEHLTLAFILVMFMWILSPIILACNGMTIIVVVKYIKNVTPTHIAICFLALAGFFAGIIPLCRLILYLMADSVHSKFVNVLNLWVTLAARTLNIFAILLIGVERCFLVTSFMFYKKYMTVRRQGGLCIVFCILSFLLSTIFTLVADSEFSHKNIYRTQFGKGGTFLLYVWPPIYAIITCILVFCYLKIYMFLWKHRKTVILSQNGSGQINRTVKKRRKQPL